MKTRSVMSGSVAALIMLLATSRPVSAVEPFDLVLINGRFVTLDAESPTAEAVAIRGGKIVSIGRTTSIEKLAADRKRLIDLEGRTVIPGLIESHSHALGVAISEMRSPYSEQRSIADVQAWLRKRTSEVPAGRWVHVPRTDIMRLDEMRFPTVAELDAASPDHPIVLTSVRKHVLNTAAWHRLGVRNPNDEVTGAKIIRDAQGRPWMLSGGSQLLRDETTRPEFTDDEKLQAVRRVHSIYNSVGITSIFERALSRDQWKLYQKLYKGGEQTVRVTATIRQQFSNGKQVEDFSKAIGVCTGDGDDWLRVGPLKITVDGGIHWGSTYLREPFGPKRIEFYKIGSLVDDDYRGDLRYPVERMREVFEAGHRLGWQMCCHVTGDAGVDRVLEALENVNEQLPLNDRRFTLTHAYFPAHDQMPRLRKLGIGVDTQSYLYYRDARFIHRIYGPDWAERFIATGMWYGYGIPVAINSDHMSGLEPDHSMNSFNPFLALSIAVTRRDVYGNVYGKHQRLRREEALRCMTTNPAWLSFDESRKGRIVPGYLADMVVLDRDYFACAEEEIAKIKPVLTVVDGKVVFDARAKQ